MNRALLPGLVDNAVALVSLYADDQLIGTAAIKTPIPAHHVGEFVKANAEPKAPSYPVELGWVVVHPDWRGRGHARVLIGEAVKLAEHRGIYATTKTLQMLAILQEQGFTPVGDPLSLGAVSRYPPETAGTGRSRQLSAYAMPLLASYSSAR